MMFRRERDNSRGLGERSGSRQKQLLHRRAGKRPRQRRCRVPRPWSPRLSAGPRRASWLCWVPPRLISACVLGCPDWPRSQFSRRQEPVRGGFLFVCRPLLPDGGRKSGYVAPWARETLDEAEPPRDRTQPRTQSEWWQLPISGVRLLAARRQLSDRELAPSTRQLKLAGDPGFRHNDIR